MYNKYIYQGLQNLSPNIQAHAYYQFISQLNDAHEKKDLNAVKSLEKKLKDLNNGNWKNMQWLKNLDWRYNLVRLELENNNVNKKQIIDYFQKTYLNLRFDYPNPQLRNKTNK